MPPKRKGVRKVPPFELYGSWQWAVDSYEDLIAKVCDRMPAACAAGLDGLADAQGLLRHYAEVLLDRIVRQTPLTATFTKKLENSLRAGCLAPTPAEKPWRAPGTGLDSYRQWRRWRQRILGVGQDAAFCLSFQLMEPPAEDEVAWTLQFVAVPRDDPSQRLALADYWSMSPAERKQARRQLGGDFETQVLLNLGLAARMVPKLREGLDTAVPQGVGLDLDGAFALKGFTDRGRLQRGRGYNGERRILAFAIDNGLVIATVRGNVSPYYGVYKEPRWETRIQMAPIPSAEWEKAIVHLGSNAALVAKLLMNEMPENIDQAFAWRRHDAKTENNA